ncbi:UPF0598 protein CG30010 isoform X1 [Anoplophora glabripennis]|uniref:UPF0598 protein CG30010 isoform X1 n=1 Tax=Anoplophora glabripennis TaxID=217634 RepID=UPI00087580DA|nr:UPF0598 protein CG30010 isoform X1 [Anoplophora glabripennis]
MITEIRNLILLSSSVKINKQGQFFRNVSYVQGQEPEPKIREYFYYIDHQGMLFLDDARMKNFTSCFKEKKFLRFFFNCLTINTTGRYKEFPYISLCGKERNFVKCDDYPFVFTHVLNKEDQEELRLAYNHAGDFLTLTFQPEKIFMLPETGRVYHPAPDRAGSIGLIRSKLAIEFSKYFLFDEGEFSPPTQFIYENKTYNLDRHWYHNVIKTKPIQTIGI